MHMFIHIYIYAYVCIHLYTYIIHTYTSPQRRIFCITIPRTHRIRIRIWIQGVCHWRLYPILQMCPPPNLIHLALGRGCVCVIACVLACVCVREGIFVFVSVYLCVCVHVHVCVCMRLWVGGGRGGGLFLVTFCPDPTLISTMIVCSCMYLFTMIVCSCMCVFLGEVLVCAGILCYLVCAQSPALVLSLADAHDGRLDIFIYAYICTYIYILIHWHKVLLLRLSLDCNKLQYTATHCNTLQYNASHCNTLWRDSVVLCCCSLSPKHLQCYVSLCTYICKSMYICTFTYIYIRMWIYVYIYMHLCTYV